MRKPWESNSIEVAFSACTPEHEQILLEETGRILYSYFCQLDRVSLSPETTAAASQTKRSVANGQES